MSSEALPISPTRFAAALPDLPLSTLHLKVLELRNSIAHLDYSNEQLRPFAEGTATATTTSTTQTSTTTPPQQTPSAAATAEPDADCADAIRENEGVIARMQERIALVRAEVERRGLGWAEFQSVEEREAERVKRVGVNGDGGDGEGEGEGEGLVNGAGVVNGDGEGQEGSNPWRDGTFQTGVIRGGVVQMDDGPTGRAPQGGSLTDEELLRRIEQQMRGLGPDEDDGEGGLHL
ncbi:hypothetical protein F5144DRAFT_625112 [Chaetomium tenue]|uniref:Uncharacterized protein n=1 Tax=Chaetomium tenue TaxID=1854479 RepID=A0ACB7PLC8_9PEZI|nr:hypothetical protein F5144DRAFT_625112 [Chaetomium globosum]